MATTQTSNIVQLAQAIGVDIGLLNTKVGNLANLTTSEKSSIVEALNELKVSLGDGLKINDTTASTTEVFSSSKVNSLIADAIDSIIDGAPEAYDTLKELADYVASDQSAASAMTTAINKRVRFDATQSLTVEEQAQACNNIGIGDPTTDFVVTYNAAKA